MAACKRCGVACGSDLSMRGGVAPRELCADCEATAARTAIWHVAVGDAAHGPYTRDELMSFRESEQLAAESFVHREGWVDWKRCADVDELRETASVLPPVPVAVTLPPLPAQQAELEPSAPEPVAAPLQAAMGNDPFADRELDNDSDDEVTRHGQIHGGGFDGVTAKSWDLDHVPALAALSASGRGVVPHAGRTVGEGSGVIHMASLISNGRALQDPTMHSIGVGGATHGQHPGQRRLSRVQLERVRPSVLVGLAFAGLLLGMGSILAWSAVRGSGKTAPELQAQANAAVADAARLASASPAAAQAAPEPVAVAELEPAPSEAPPEIVIDEATANAHELATRDDGEQRERAARAKAARVSRWQAKRAARLAAKARRASRWAAKHAAASDSFASASAPKHSAPRSDDGDEPAVHGKAASKQDSLDDLVEGAISAKHRPTKVEAAAKSDEFDLPETPSRDEMLAALSRAKSLVAKCKGSGMATVSINLKGPAGRASKVSVEGVEGSSRSCVESAIKKTAFPKFQQENFAVKAPFKLQET
jgi:hypothetical protein